MATVTLVFLCLGSSLYIKLMFALFFVVFVVVPQSPSLPPTPSSVPPNGNAGMFAFPPNMIQAVKQKSAFNPVMRPPVVSEGGSPSVSHTNSAALVPG